MTVLGVVRRTVRAGLRWWWNETRPRAGADLRGAGRAHDPALIGRPPLPSERWQPSTVPSGSLAGVDPHVAPPWPSRGQALGVLLWAGLVGAYARRVQAARAQRARGVGD